MTQQEAVHKTKSKILTKKDGISAATHLKNAMQNREDIRLHHVYLYGSVARDEAHEWNDIDIAVVCDQFHLSKIKEVREFDAADPEKDTRISIVVLHPEDMSNAYSTLAQEIKKDGIEA